MSNADAISLVQSEGGFRVDSRLLAEHLGIQHENTYDLIRRYEADFLELGVLRFETGKPPAGSKGGRPEQYALLNEDQSYLLLTYTRNTAKVRALKLKLVKAFRDVRNQANIDSMIGLILLTTPAPWEKRFGDRYYRSLAKVTGTSFTGHAKGTPAIFGQITDRWVYAVILPKEIHAELKTRRGDSERMHQWLTDGGRERLDHQIRMVTVLADSSIDRGDFEARCTRAFGVPGQLRLIYP